MPELASRNFEDLVQAGKVLAWGLSNFDERDLAAAVASAGEDEARRIDEVFPRSDRLRRRTDVT